MPAADVEQALLALTAMTALFLVPTAGLLVGCALASIYRVADVKLAVGPVELGVDRAALAVTAMVLGLRYAPMLMQLLISRSGVLAVLLFGVGGAVTSLPTSLNTTATLASIAFGGARAVVALSVLAWLRQDGKRQTILLRGILLTAVVGAVQALVAVPLLGAPVTEAATSLGAVERRLGFGGGLLPSLLLIGIALAGSMFVSQGRRKATVILMLLIPALVLTYVRGALIDLFIIGVLIGMVHAKGFKRVRMMMGILATMIFSLTLLVATQANFRARLTQLDGSQDSTLDTRLMLWRSALRIWRENPLTGVGAGAFNEGLRTFDPFSLPPDFYSIFRYPENQYLGLLSETGVVGTVLYAAANAVLIFGLVQAARRRQDMIVTFCAVIFLGRAISEVSGLWFTGSEVFTLATGLALFRLWSQVAGNVAEIPGQALVEVRDRGGLGHGT